jgi:hypothetical protein
MPDVFLDAYVFSCPRFDEGPEAFEAYVRNLLSWQELRNAEWLTLYSSNRTIEVLFETSSYPLWNDLKAALSLAGTPNIQAKDVVNVVDALLSKLGRIEDRLGIKDILIGPYQCKPSYHLTTRLPEFVENYQLLTTFMCLHVYLGMASDENQVLVTRGLKEDDQTIEISSEIMACQYYGIHSESEPARNVTGKFVACTDPHGLEMALDPIAMWQTATCEQTYRRAIEVYVYQRCSASGTSKEPDDWLPWSFGNQFLSIIGRSEFVDQADRIAKLLRALAETILEESLSATHPLRMSSGGGAPQRTRRSDGATAWRRDIDYELHLHYWRTPRGLEFASVAHHNDMGIPA